MSYCYVCLYNPESDAMFVFFPTHPIKKTKVRRTVVSDVFLTGIKNGHEADINRVSKLVLRGSSNIASSIFTESEC